MVGRLLVGLLLTISGMAAKAMPEIQTWHTKGGMPVWFVQDHELPMVDVRLVFDAAARRDGDQYGLAQLTSRMLEQGAAGRSAQVLADELDAVGASVKRGLRRDRAWISLRTLSDPAVMAMSVPVLIDMVSRPDFPEPALKSVRQRLLSEIRRSNEKPSAVAEQAFFSALFEEHAYANPVLGTEAQVSIARVTHLQAFHRKHYTRSSGVIALVGDLSRNQAEALAETLSSSLPQGIALQAVPEVAEATARKVVRIPMSGKQTQIFMGEAVLSRNDPDYFPLYVGNHILGGNGLMSRMGQEVREERGLSYSVACLFVPMERRGPFLLGLQTSPEKVGETLDVMHQVLNRFIEGGPTLEELKLAKENLIGGFALRMAGNERLARQLAIMAFYKLSPTYLQQFAKQVRKVDSRMIKEAFQRRLHTHRMVTVLAGSNVNVAVPKLALRTE